MAAPVAAFFWRVDKFEQPAKAKHEISNVINVIFTFFIKTLLLVC
jgi:hypothetical protein